MYECLNLNLKFSYFQIIAKSRWNKQYEYFNALKLVEILGSDISSVIF